MNRHPALDDPRALDALLDVWVTAGWLRPIDRAVAGFFQTHEPNGEPLAVLAAVFASHQAGGGHVCLDLLEVLGNPDFTLRMPPADPFGPQASEVDTPAHVLAGVNPSAWMASLTGYPAVRTATWDEDTGIADGRPLLLVDGERPQLYLRRYWQVEGQVAAGLAARSSNESGGPDVTALRGVLDALYPAEARKTTNLETDWQKVACALAAYQPFSIITGGPGTGKTTTVVRLLAALISLDAGAAARRSPRIALCAPTGKAAARLAESIGDKVREIGEITAAGFAEDHWMSVSQQLPTEVLTIHRLIGTRPLAERPRYHRDNPLDLDIVVVDEASMVGLELMAQLVDALPADCRLVVLGDKDQLASVEAGAVLGELCREADSGGYAADLQAFLEAATGESVDRQGMDQPTDPVNARIAMLRYSHRFGHDSAIGRLARAVNAGHIEAAETELGTPAGQRNERDVAWLTTSVGVPRTQSALAAMVIEGMRPWLKPIVDSDGFDPANEQDEQHLAVVFAAHNGFQVLSALRRGSQGVQGLNAQIEAWLSEAGLIPPAVAGQGGWYPGRPVIITRNEPQLDLANGDMGLTVPIRMPNGETGLRVVFPSPSVEPGAARFQWISPARLAEAETGYALTVHKSQGSEFTHVLLVMPQRPNPILTRELLYTAITRARRRFTLVSPGGDRPEDRRHVRTVLTSAVESTTRRSGNLRRRLSRRLPGVSQG